MSRIKICGLRRPEDIAAVNEARPDYCGFIVEYPKADGVSTGQYYGNWYGDCGRKLFR